MILRSKMAFCPSALTLGTVQLGLDYGIANFSGQPKIAEAEVILDAAVVAGISTFDTARAYGSSEERIGDWRAARQPAGLNIVTKIPKLDVTGTSQERAFVTRSLELSRAALQMDTIDLVLMHNAADLLRPAVIAALAEAKHKGHICGYGASCYDHDEAFLLLENAEPDAIQIPMNVTDRKCKDSGLLAACAESGVTVFIRSIFLQGALLLTETDLPEYLGPLSEPLVALDRLASSLNRKRAEILLVAVRENAPEASLIIGVETRDQLMPHVAAMQSEALPQSVVTEIFDCFSCLPASVTDPRAWPR